MKIMTVAITFALLVGCSSKEQIALMEEYEKEKNYHTQLQKTEKIQLYDGEITKLMLTATYLFDENSDNNKSNEVFIVGIYFEEEENFSLKDKNDSLTLNNISPKSINVLKESDPLLKNISFVSEWSQFYQVTFPHTSSKSFKLVFKNDIYGKGELHFAKVAKFVLSKKAF